MENEIVNGINIKNWFKTIELIKKNPELAKFKFKAFNEWVDGTHCRTRIKNFCGAGKENASREYPFFLEGDEPVVLFGKDQGPNAFEALLHALATCLNTTFMFEASARGIPIDNLEFDLEGTLDLQGALGINENAKNGFQNIQITCRATSDASEKILEETCQLAQKRSPVFNIVTNKIPVSIKLETEIPVGRT